MNLNDKMKERKKLIDGIDLSLFKNLNKIMVVNHGITSSQVEVVFRNLKTKLIQIIKDADAVIGAVAWITDADILEVLAERPTLLVIQKEDFLRPDLMSRLTDEAKEKLRQLYNNFRLFDGWKVSVGPFSQGIDKEFSALSPILCFGYYKQGQTFRLPKMHNKFIVFLKKQEELYVPYAVWTGSYNFTEQSAHSLENAVIIKDGEVASAYASEAQIIYLMGEPLDWSSEWINPIKKTAKISNC